MKNHPIVPAIIPKNEAEILRYSKELSFSKELQLDLVDGQFVEAICWPYEPTGEPLSVKTALDIFTLEVDLMVRQPLLAAEKWISAGADMLVFHVETLTLEDLIEFISETKVSIGVSAHGDTPLSTLMEYASVADYIQLMGIYEIGAQGLPFDENVLNKVDTLKQKFPDMMISVDGSVNINTISLLRDAGVDRFVCGSAIVSQSNPEQAYKNLSALINE